MGRKRRKNNSRGQRKNAHRSEASTSGKRERPARQANARSAESRWLKPVAISVIGGLVVAAVTVLTPLFKSRLSIVNVPALTNMLGVIGGEDSVRNLVEVYFCVKNGGVAKGSISRISVNPLGLNESPGIVVQEFDQAPISGFEERGVFVKFVMLDRMALPELSSLRFDVYDEADRWIGNFMVDTKRPLSVKTLSDGSKSTSMSVTFAGFAADACRRSS